MSEEMANVSGLRRSDREAIEALEAARLADKTRLAELRAASVDLEEQAAKLVHALRQVKDEKAALEVPLCFVGQRHSVAVY